MEEAAPVADEPVKEEEPEAAPTEAAEAPAASEEAPAAAEEQSAPVKEEPAPEQENAPEEETPMDTAVESGDSETPAVKTEADESTPMESEATDASKNDSETPTEQVKQYIYICRIQILFLHIDIFIDDVLQRPTAVLYFTNDIQNVVKAFVVNAPVTISVVLMHENYDPLKAASAEEKSDESTTEDNKSSNTIVPSTNWADMVETELAEKVRFGCSLIFGCMLSETKIGTEQCTF